MQDRIEQVAKEELARAREARNAAQSTTEQPQSAPAQDYYQMQANAAQEASQRPTAYGSPAQLTQVVDQAVEDTKERYFNAYNNQYEHQVDAENRNGAQQIAQEYMMNFALPLVEGLVEEYGVDALLNNPAALSRLDEIMITGNGVGDGFTKSYLAQMHFQTVGTQGTQSDMGVGRGLQRVASMADGNDIRGSVSLARQLKGKVDKGELAASEDDYKTLVRVASYK